MAIDQLAYVESWDSPRFHGVPTRLSLEQLRAIMPASHGHEGMGRDSFPFHREWSGLVRYHQTVVAFRRECTCAADPDCQICGGDGWWEEALSGHEAVASAITESWCSDNPALFEGLIETWIKDAAAEAVSDERTQREEQKAIAAHPQLAEALARSPYKVFKRAELTDREVRVFELRFDRQKSLVEIGLLFNISHPMVREIIQSAVDKILALDAETAGE